MTLPIELLFVCTANICRSPMAAIIIQQLLDEEYGKGVFECSSAGGYHLLLYDDAIDRIESQSMTPTAVESLKKNNYKVSNQFRKPQRVNEEMIKESSVVFCLGENIYKAISEKFKIKKNKIFYMMGGKRKNMPDPYDLTNYNEEEYKKILGEEYKNYFPNGHHGNFALEEDRRPGGRIDEKVGKWLPAYEVTLEIMESCKDIVIHAAIETSITNVFKDVMSNNQSKIDDKYADKLKLHDFFKKEEDQLLMLKAIIVIDKINEGKIDWLQKTKNNTLLTNLINKVGLLNKNSEGLIKKLSLESEIEEQDITNRLKRICDEQTNKHSK